VDIGQKGHAGEAKASAAREKSGRWRRLSLQASELIESGTLEDQLNKWRRCEPSYARLCPFHWIDAPSNTSGITRENSGDKSRGWGSRVKRDA
jgi:hypothetical protein